MAETGYILSARDIARIAAAVRAFEANRPTSGGGEMRDLMTPFGRGLTPFVINNFRPYLTPTSFGAAGVELSPINRWQYSGQQAAWRDSVGVVASGSVTTTVGGNPFGDPILNPVEAFNDGQGMEGVGVNFSEPPLQGSGMKLRPIRVPNLVWCRRLPAAIAGHARPWMMIGLSNALRGPCTP